MNITPQIASAYYTTPIQSTYFDGGIFTIIKEGISGIDMSVLETHPEEFKLILKPLSLITDEDFKHVAALTMNNPQTGLSVAHDEMDFGDIIRDGEKATSRVYCRCLECDLYFFFSSLSVRVGLDDGIICPSDNMVEVIDYLRSKGYDCGYGAIPSLIEADMAIKEQDSARSVATDAK